MEILMIMWMLQMLVVELADFGTAAADTRNDLVSWIKKCFAPSQVRDLSDANILLYRFEHERLAWCVLSQKLRRGASVNLPSMVGNEMVSITRVSFAKYKVKASFTRRAYNDHTLEYDNVVTYQYYTLNTSGRTYKVSTWYIRYGMPTPRTYATWQELRELCHLLPDV